MPLAVLLDAVSEAAEAPVFALQHRGGGRSLTLSGRGNAVIGIDQGANAIGNRFNLRLRYVVACNEHAFI